MKYILLIIFFSISANASISFEGCTIKNVSENNNKLNGALEYYEDCGSLSSDNVFGLGYEEIYGGHSYRNAFINLNGNKLMSIGIAIADEARGNISSKTFNNHILIHSNLDEVDVVKIYYESIVPTFDCINNNACFKNSLKSNFFKFLFDENYSLFKEDVLKATKEGTVAGFISHISLENSKNLFITYESNTGKSWHLKYFMGSKQRFILSEVRVLLK